MLFRDTVKLVENQRNVFLIKVGLMLIIILEFLIVIFLFVNKQSPAQQTDIGNVLEKKETGINLFYEKIPGSKFHGPDGTWWGYNQSKIVRFGDIVFMYVIENQDDKNTTFSDLVVYKKMSNEPWKKGAMFKTSRPGNILIDSNGVLHAFVFEPTNVVKNDSWGKLKHYWFPNAQKGDVTNYKEEIIIDNDGTTETVNIRVGAAISQDDTMAIGFGLTSNNPLYKGHSEHLYVKKPPDLKWQHLIAGENIGHDWYYPFIWMEKNSYYLLPVQDDYNGSGSPQMPYPNIYQKIMYFEYSNGNWQKELVADLSLHPLAKKRPRLLEQEDLYKDKKGIVHILYKEFLDENVDWTTNDHVHLTRTNNGNSSERIPKIGKEDINWIRMFEVDNSLYYLYVLYDSAYIRKEGTQKLVSLPIPKDAHGTYPYIATKRGGTSESEQFIDILFLSADQKDYKDGTNVNYYIRIPKTEFEKLK